MATDPYSQLDRLRALLRDPASHAVVALGITQIVSWGTTLYALGVLGSPISQDMGWSRSLVFGGLTVGLLASSLVSTLTGRMIDRHGARRVMSIGTVLNALGLLWLSLAEGPLGYLAAWAFLGPAMRMTLYDAAFAALVQVTPTRGRRAISFLTLFGGFASTIFWPIGHMLNAEFGWRETFLIYAVGNILICLPLHWWGLARREPGADVFDDDAAAGNEGEGEQSAPRREQYLTGRSKTIAIILFGGVMSANAFVFGAIAVHLVNIIAGSGVVLASAVFIASFKGVAQVVGRVWDLVFARNMKPVNIGRVTIFFLPLSFLILMLGGASFTTAMIFTLVLGASNGLVTIVRGAVPLGLFGPKGYGEVLGILATPYLVLNALAPVIFAAIIDAWGYEIGEIVLFAVGLLTVAAMEVMALWIRRLG